MNFIGDEAICGTVNNPLRKVINVSTPMELFPGKNPNVERQPGRIENEFMEFKAMNKNIDMIPVPQGIQMDIQRNNDMGSNWVDEFSQMSLMNQQTISHAQHQQRAQHQQQQQFQYTQSQPIYHNNHNIHLQNHHVTPAAPATTVFGSGIFNNIQNTLSSSMKSLTDFQAFDNAFTEVEKDLQDVMEEEIPKVLIEEEDNKNFANIAQSVFNIMNNTQPSMNVSTTTCDKFKTSKFMDLMQRISNKEVEIDSEGEKLINVTNKGEGNVNNGTGMFDSAIEMGSKFGFKVEKSNWEDGDFI